jgi:hypothetical protein
MGSAGASGGVGSCTKASPTNVPPGPAVTDWATEGQGACVGRSLQSVVDTLHADHPELADIVNLWTGQGTDGSYVRAFMTPAPSFAIVMDRGSGDCPAGCIKHQYFYFETGVSCTAQPVGKYDPMPGPKCLTDSGEAMWATPIAPPLAAVCGDETPQDISGTKPVYATGNWVVCSAGKESPTPFDGCLSLVVEQEPGNLAKGTVRLLGTGDARLSQPMAATFKRRSFQVMVDEKSGTCQDSTTVSFSYDEEAYPAGTLSDLTVVSAADCSTYCKGGAGFTLFPAAMP